MTTIRDAILAAAAHISASPQQHDWGKGYLPAGADISSAIACPLCWIGAFLSPGQVAEHPKVSMNHLGVYHDTFYERCSALVGLDDMAIIYKAPAVWVTALRLYADKYHPAKPIQQPPVWWDIARTRTVADDADAMGVQS